ncbi:hypothetical protein AAY473_005482 [Plecturocebus cupreus]
MVAVQLRLASIATAGARLLRFRSFRERLRTTCHARRQSSWLIHLGTNWRNPLIGCFRNAFLRALALKGADRNASVRPALGSPAGNAR